VEGVPALVDVAGHVTAVLALHRQVAGFAESVCECWSALLAGLSYGSRESLRVRRCVGAAQRRARDGMIKLGETYCACRM
jgi:hypothetical protein